MPSLSREHVGSEGVAEDMEHPPAAATEVAVPGSRKCRIFIPYPTIDSVEARLVKQAAEPGYSGPPVSAMRDQQYVLDIQTVAAALARFGIDLSRPEPVAEGTDRLSVVTVTLERGLTADAIRRALPGFQIEEIGAGG